MSKLLVTTVLGSSLLIAGCSTTKYEHDNQNGHHGGQNHHREMMGDGGMGHKMEGHQGHDMTQMKGHGGGHTHGSEESLAGKPGLDADVSRVINVTATDDMRFSHEPLNIKDGETIKFVVTNKGKMPHEFAIGTKDEHMDHGKMMMANPGMHHGPGGNAITINAGETKALVWLFENAWQIEAACNIPGHYQAGMHSPVVIGK